MSIGGWHELKEEKEGYPKASFQSGKECHFWALNILSSLCQSSDSGGEVGQPHAFRYKGILLQGLYVMASVHMSFQKGA